MENSRFHIQGAKFLAGLALGFVLTACVWLALIWFQVGVPTASSQWAYEILQLKTRILAASHQPTLILVGGSSTVFGMNAKEIEARIGIHTVNFGIHGGLGTRYLLYAAEQVAKPGDTVLLGLEYSIYDTGVTYVLADYVFSRDPHYLSVAPLSDVWKIPLFLTGPRLLLGLVGRISGGPARAQAIDGCYTTATLDERGDETCNLESKRTPAQIAYIQQQQWSYEKPRTLTAAPEIREFLAWARLHRVRVLAAYPGTLRKPCYETPRWQAFFKQMAAFYKANGVPLLGDPESLMYDPSSLYDYSYHLNDRGARDRTAQLIPQLKPYFANDATQTTATRARVTP